MRNPQHSMMALLKRGAPPRVALPATRAEAFGRNGDSVVLHRLMRAVVLVAWIPLSVIAFFAAQPEEGIEKAWLAAAAVALMFAAHEVRRTLSRQRALLQAMRRVANRDFSARVSDPGLDDLAQLASTFNEMTARLGLKFAALDALSQIDQIILSKFDIEAVARLALLSARRIVGCEFVLLGLFESNSGDSIRTFALRGAGSDDLHRNRFALDATLRARIPATASTHWAETAPLPETFFARLSGRARRPVFNVRPVSLGGRNWGILVLGHGEALALHEEQQELLAGIADRLAVAFSTGERDRRLHLLAHRDPLTGLPNRNALLELLHQEIARAQRSQTRVAVLFLDLDRFKQTNDTLGHAVGDSLLREAAKRIRASVRSNDAVARHGGDEFTVVLGDLANTSAASQVARQLIQALSARYEIDGHTVYAGASVGIAVYPDDGTDAADLLKKADTAMYRAKEDGRSRLVYFEEKMNRDALHRAALYRELRRALRARQFVLHYQPQIDLRTGTVCSVEALVRWQHPERGLIQPSAFIPFAEENGLIDAIGAWVLNEACQQHQRWRAAGVPIPRVSVNVSVLQLRRSNFVDSVKGLLERSATPPGGLELEVTESLFIEGGPTAMEAVRALANLGVQIALDDFGSGYFSFGYLQTSPAPVLKLDRSFVMGVPHDPKVTSVVSMMVGLAHTLGKEVVAEGVDSAQQLAYLRHQGCDRVQGFLFSPAVEAVHAAAFARRLVAQPIGAPAAASASVAARGRLQQPELLH